MEEYEVVVIGAGPGGYAAAIRAADLGKKVAIIERREIGGTCLNRGCIPTKALLRSAEIYEMMKKGTQFGIVNESLSYDLESIHKRKKEVVERLRTGIEFLLKKRGVAIKKGSGKLADRGSVEIDTKTGKETIRGENLIIATGSEPAQLFKPDGKNVLTSDHALELKAIPKSLVIVGAGAIGIEFATYFSSFGAKVIVVERLEEVLPSLCSKNSKVAVMFRRSLKRRGIEIKTGVRIENIEIKGEGRVASKLSNGEVLESKKVLVSVGRRLNLTGLGLEEIGVRMKGGGIWVDKKLRTNVPNIYAIGDVIGGSLLAHKAEKEGEVAAEVIAGRNSKMDYRVMPCVVFSHPEFASVGLSENQAKARGMEIAVGEFLFAGNGKALCLGETEGLARVVVDTKTKEIVGAQIFGSEASVMISEVAVAMENGITVEDVGKVVHVHPTLSEVLMEACKDAVGEGIHK